jgi:protoheme IX farnesyltransferase
MTSSPPHLARDVSSAADGQQSGETLEQASPDGAEPPTAPPGRPSVVRDLWALTKPRITATVVATMLSGAWVAKRAAPPAAFDGVSLALAVLGTALVVSGANALNMYLERDSDGLMTRTAQRPLPQRRLPASAALAFGVLVSLLSMPLLYVGGGWVTTALAAFSLVSYVMVYTPLKRRTTLALPIGAVPGAMPPLLGYTAVRGAVEPVGLALFALLFLWQLPHFHAIGTFRRTEYARAGLRVLAAEASIERVYWHVVLEVFAVVAVSLVLVPLGAGGLVYALVAGSLGCAFAAAALQRGGRAPEAWARRVFAVSLVYLVVVFGALIVG